MGTDNEDIDASELGPLTPCEIGETDGIFRCFQYPPHACWPNDPDHQGRVSIKPCHIYFGADGKAHHGEEPEIEEKKRRSLLARRADALSVKNAFKRIYPSQIPAGSQDLSSAGIEPDFYDLPKDRANFGAKTPRWSTCHDKDPNLMDKELDNAVDPI